MAIALAMAISAAVVIGPRLDPVGAVGAEVYGMEMLSPRADPSAIMSHALGITTDSSGVTYVSESTGRVIRIENGVYEVVHGYSGQAVADQALWPTAVATDATGNLFISDRQKHRVQMLTPAGVLSTVAGTGSAGSGAGQLNSPMELDFDSSGNLYINDSGNDRIMILPPGGTISVIADLTMIPGGLHEGILESGALAMGVTPEGVIHFCDIGRMFRIVNSTYEQINDTGFGRCKSVRFDASGRRYVLSDSPTPELWVEGDLTPQYDIPVAPENPSVIDIRPDGTMDVVTGWGPSTRQYTVSRGQDRTEISNTMQPSASHYDPQSISRSPGGRVMLADQTRQPIREFVNDHLVPIATDSVEVEHFAAGDGESYLIGPKPNHPDPVPVWISRLNADGSVTPVVRALRDTRGIYLAPDGSFWTDKPEGIAMEGSPTLFRYTGGQSEVVWDDASRPWMAERARGVVFAQDGTAYIGNYLSQVVHRRRPDGDTVVFSMAGDLPVDIDPNGRLLVLSRIGALHWVETDGSSTPIAAAGGLPGDIVDAVVTDGGERILVLIADGATNRLARLTSPDYVPPTTTTTATTSTTIPTTSTTSTAVPTTTTSTSLPAACSRLITSVEPRMEAEGLSARLYIAYFLRQPDPGGYRYWAEALANGANARDLSYGFAGSEEFRIRYSGLGDRGFITLVYSNVMCRVPDEAGYDYWLNLLDNGSISRSDLMLYFANSAEFANLTGT